MTNLQDFSAADDLNIFIAFHLPQDYYTPGVLRDQLDDKMQSVFGIDATQELINEVDDKHEVIYRIQKPLLNSTKENQIFFNKLQNVFQSTSDMFPHFTQLNNSMYTKDNN